MVFFYKIKKGVWRGARRPLGWTGKNTDEAVLDSPGHDWHSRSGSEGSSSRWVKPGGGAACKTPSTTLWPQTPASRGSQRSDTRKQQPKQHTQTWNALSVGSLNSLAGLKHSTTDHWSTGQGWWRVIWHYQSIAFYIQLHCTESSTNDSPSIPWH